MKRTDLFNVLKLGEGLSMEAKSARGGFPDSFWETYSSFANTNGGVILLGIKEEHDHTLTVDGLPDVDKTMRDLWNMVNNRQKVNRNILSNKLVYVMPVEGKDVLVVEVPRAERTARPIYKGQDPFLGTYRRYNEGDHLCTAEVVGAMMRDSSLVPMDSKTIDYMDMSVFCQESVESYFRLFKLSKPNHLWGQLEIEMFLRRIRAVDMGEDGSYHPTEAGLLMFGYEYEITRRFPQYFLDYQEDRQLIGVTRWKDRITSNSGDWSGNLFDFVFKILGRLQSDLKTPFVLKGNQRVDDTPMHKLLREATINSLIHADYNGRQGVVISKGPDGFAFANPGRMRIPIEEAIGGGVSDPRNSTLLNMFSLIRFGERAGSGLNGILYLWEKIYHTKANIKEKDGEVDRTILTLPYNGHSQDIEAMLQFYDDPTEYSVEDFASNTGADFTRSAEVMAHNGRNTIQKDGDTIQKTDDTIQKDKNTIQKDDDTIQKTDDTIQKDNKTIQKTIQKDGNTIQKEDGTIQKLTVQQKAILSYLSNHANAKRADIKGYIPDASMGGIIYNLSRLQQLGLLKRVGGRKGGHWEVML